MTANLTNHSRALYRMTQSYSVHTIRGRVVVNISTNHSTKTTEQVLPLAPLNGVRLFLRSEHPAGAQGSSFPFRISYYEENQAIPPAPTNRWKETNAPKDDGWLLARRMKTGRKIACSK